MPASIFSKISRLCDILTLPQGLKLKLTESAFNLDVLRLCHRLKKAGVNPDTIFDVGANIGQFAVAARSQFPTALIHSFEPVPAAVTCLKNTAAKYLRIEIHQMALSESAGEAEFHVTSQTQSSSLLRLSNLHKEIYPQVSETEVIPVTLSTIEDQVRSIQPKGECLLKLDVQGAEMLALRGARESLSRFRWILLETSTRSMYEGETTFTEIHAFLDAKGFALFSPMDLHFSEDGKPGQFDVLYQLDS